MNQLRQKIGVVYGNPETTTGGNALKFYCSASGPPFDGCPLCDEEAHASRSAPGSSQRRGARGKA